MNSKVLKSFLTFVFFILLFQLSAQHKAQKQTSFTFIQNKGQWQSNALFKANLGGLNNVYLEDQAFTYVFSNHDDVEKIHDVIYATDEIRDAHIIRSHAYKVLFKNAIPVQPEGLEMRNEYYNYILGNDPEKWTSYVPLFEQVKYQNLYPGIDLKTYSSGRYFKYDFIVKAGVDPLQIVLKYEGTEGIKIDEGDLIIYTSVETIIEKKPYAYQITDNGKKEVDCQYILTGNQVTFDFPEGYDHSKPLIIDPTVVAATLSGTFGAANFGHCATYDYAENIYTGGISFGVGYPTTTGAFQTDFNDGYTDIAISKYNPEGSELIYATYIGGNNREFPQSMITDFDQQLYIYGSTESSNFPITGNAFQQSKAGSSDIIVTKLNSDGSALIGSTYIGGIKTGRL